MFVTLNAPILKLGQSVVQMVVHMHQSANSKSVPASVVDLRLNTKAHVDVCILQQFTLQMLTTLN